MRDGRKVRGRWWLLFAGVVLGGCGCPTETTGSYEDLDRARQAPGRSLTHRPWRLAPTPLGRVVIGWSDAGAPVLFDSRSGAVIDEASPSPPDRSGSGRDVAWDPYQQRVLRLDCDPDEQSGEISTLSVTGLQTGWPSWARQEHRAWVDGRARLWPLPDGIVVFEEGLGERWRLLRDDGVPTASVAASRPASVWSYPRDAGLEILALGHGPAGGGPALQRLEGLVSAEQGVRVCTRPLRVAPTTIPPTARMVPWRPADDTASTELALVVDLAAGRPLIHLLGPAGPLAKAMLGVRQRFGRLEQALALPGPRRGRRGLVVLLMSRPSAVVVATADADFARVSAAMLELPGATRVEDRFFGRAALGVAANRVLAATDAGVWAIGIRSQGREVSLALDRRFDGSRLRGPLAGPLAATWQLEASRRPREASE